VARIETTQVIRAGIAYLAGAWLFVQVAETVIGAFDAPGWAMRVLLFVSAFGFPVAILLAWIYELTPAGLQKTSALRDADTRTRAAAYGPGIVVGALITGGLLGSGTIWFLGSDSDEQRARDEAVPQLESIIQTADWQAAFELANTIEDRSHR